mmetsp:Transcript_28833/g.62825  ORF Transcript_28833/g.62825 Transcript_28833/m.62825 type:complete len:107 (+) Transcript_28833:76-396(+)
MPARATGRYPSEGTTIFLLVALMLASALLCLGSSLGVWRLVKVDLSDEDYDWNDVSIDFRLFVSFLLAWSACLVSAWGAEMLGREQQVSEEENRLLKMLRGFVMSW